MKWQAIVQLFLLLLSLLLDARDVYFQVVRLPHFSFTSINEVHKDNRLPTIDKTFVQKSDAQWSSFLGLCDELRFLPTQPVSKEASTVKLSNCHHPSNDSSVILSVNLRPDAVAWTLCKALQVALKPAICHHTIVSRFASGAQFTWSPTTPEMSVPINSNAEEEIVHLLSILGEPNLLENAMCFRGYQSFEEKEVYMPEFIGCAVTSSRGDVSAETTPVHQIALVGFNARSIVLSLNDKENLFTSTFSLFDRIALRIRQSGKTTKVTHATSAPDSAIATHRTVTIRVEGVLLNIFIVIKISIFVYGTLSTWELLRDVLLPKLLDPTSSSSDVQGDKLMSFTFCMCSLSRHSLWMGLTIACQVFTWLFLGIFSTIITQSENRIDHLHVWLTLLQSWLTVMYLISRCWGLVVFVKENVAYRIASKTRISSGELIGITAIALGMMTAPLQHASEMILLDEGQRQQELVQVGNTSVAFEWVSVPGKSSRDNSKLLFFCSYFALLLAQCCGISILVLCLRYAYNYRRASPTPTSNSGVAPDQTLLQADQGEHDTENSEADQKAIQVSTQPQNDYTRLDLERVLCTPIRALALVRSGPLKTTDGEKATSSRSASDELHLWQYLEHGFILEDNKQYLRPRLGFYHRLSDREAPKAFHYFPVRNGDVGSPSKSKARSHSRQLSSYSKATM